MLSSNRRMINSRPLTTLSQFLFLFSVFVFAWAIPSLADPDYEVDVEASDTDIGQDVLASIAEFAAQNGFNEPKVLAAGPDDIKRLARAAKQAHRDIAELVGAGDPDQSYDLILQIGHYPKIAGSTGGQGQKRAFLKEDGERIPRVTEQDLAALVGLGIAKKLDETAVKYLIVESRPAKFGGRQKTKIFLALHTDSAIAPCSVGPSVGYDDISDAEGMHLIAFALATSLGFDPVDFMKDNYTKNLQGYYSYKYFSTELFEGLLEMGELTCPEHEVLMLERASVISEYLANAIVFALTPGSLPWKK